MDKQANEIKKIIRFSNRLLVFFLITSLSFSLPTSFATSKNSAPIAKNLTLSAIGETSLAITLEGSDADGRAQGQRRLHDADRIPPRFFGSAVLRQEHVSQGQESGHGYRGFCIRIQFKSALVR